MRRLLQIHVVAFAIALVAAAPAAAVPVEFQGGEFNVEVTHVSGTTYEFTFTADLTGWDDGTNDDFIQALDFGIEGRNDFTQADLSAVTTNAPGTWTAIEGNAAAIDCGAPQPNSFKICVSDPVTAPNAPTDSFNDIYFWTVQVTYDAVLTDEELLDNPIKVSFTRIGNDGAITGAGNLSVTTDYDSTGDVTGEETTSPTETTGNGVIPEPASLMLLGSGLVLASQRLRNRRKQQRQ